MSLPQIIQGGMGIGVSSWELAKAVSKQSQLGVVSGVGLDSVFIRRLQDGDPEGHIRRALSSFPCQASVSEVLNDYYLPQGRSLSSPYKRGQLLTIDQTPKQQRLIALASFVEVFLAKEGNCHEVGINFLEKVQLSNLSGIYGAMLAGVNFVIIGAGIPREIPGVLDSFALGQKATLKITVSGERAEDDFRVSFDPLVVFPQMKIHKILRPKFLGIISSASLALHLKRKSTGKVDGFIVEGFKAGGHNAPPRGAYAFDEYGSPVYGEKDIADIKAIAELGLPFWLAGSFGSPAKLQEALKLGASGIQVGTAFAFCEESGLDSKLKTDVIKKWCMNDQVGPERLFTDALASPTGFPFKVVPLKGTQSDPVLYEARPRICDLGYLRSLALNEKGKLVYRCAAGPIDDYVKKGGQAQETSQRKC